MNFKDKIKFWTEKIHPGEGVLLNYLPFNIRLGNDYKNYVQLADQLIKADLSTKNNYVITNFNKIFNHFKLNSGFYNHHLQKADCNLKEIRNLGDIATIPLLTKALLREMPVEDRTILKHGYKKFNTGGTSGIPLSFFLGNNFYSREWAHIHYMWRKVGYKPTQTKITIRGKNLIKYL